jgi:hypothetical protein
MNSIDQWKTFSSYLQHTQTLILSNQSKNQICSKPVRKTSLIAYASNLSSFSDLIDFWSFNATFSNISTILWRPVLVAEEAGVTGGNHPPWANNWQTFFLQAYHQYTVGSRLAL